MNPQSDKFLEYFQCGTVFAYPTEAVYGLGCDPLNEKAVNKILEIKQRPVEKGMILIASNHEQIKNFVDTTVLSEQALVAIQNSWPGPVTWLLPKSTYTPYWVSGDSDMVAVRVSAHPGVKAMCDAVQHPIISTSANPAGIEPARTKSQVFEYFSRYIEENSMIVIEGELGSQTKPSQIIHSLTMETIRV